MICARAATHPAFVHSSSGVPPPPARPPGAERCRDGVAGHAGSVPRDAARVQGGVGHHLPCAITRVPVARGAAVGAEHGRHQGARRSIPRAGARAARRGCRIQNHAGVRALAQPTAVGAGNAPYRSPAPQVLRDITTALAFAVPLTERLKESVLRERHWQELSAVPADRAQVRPTPHSDRRGPRRAAAPSFTRRPVAPCSGLRARPRFAMQSAHSPQTSRARSGARAPSSRTTSPAARAARERPCASRPTARRYTRSCAACLIARAAPARSRHPRRCRR